MPPAKRKAIITRKKKEKTNEWKDQNRFGNLADSADSGDDEDSKETTPNSKDKIEIKTEPEEAKENDSDENEAKEEATVNPATLSKLEIVVSGL